jgi:hypothetical protein
VSFLADKVRAVVVQCTDHLVCTVNFRLLVSEQAKIHRSHKRVFNGLVVIQRLAGWLRELKLKFTQ